MPRLSRARRCRRPRAGRAAVLGEFGGLGLPMEGHTWLEKGNWGYRSFTTPADLGTAYRDLHDAAAAADRATALSAAIYTQTTDVEIEVNGLMTYDRDVTKLSPAELAAWHAALYKTPPTLTTVRAHRDGQGRRLGLHDDRAARRVDAAGLRRFAVVERARRLRTCRHAMGPRRIRMDDERSLAATDVRSVRRPVWRTRTSRSFTMTARRST